MKLKAALAIALFACGPGRAPGGDSTSGSSAAAAAVTARPDSAASRQPSATVQAGSDAPPCVSEGTWQSCSVEKRLTDAGFVPIRKGASPTGVFAVPGTTYALGAAELHVYLFRSATERETAAAGIDTIAVVRRGGTSPWATPPTFITSNNLAAVLLSDNGRLIERVQNAITAGLPSAAH